MPVVVSCTVSTVAYARGCFLYCIYYSICLWLFIVDVPSNTIRIYREKSHNRKYLLPNHQSLEECGFIGSHQWFNLPEQTLYYDYQIEFNRCPLLLADSYFVSHRGNQNTNDE